MTIDLLLITYNRLHYTKLAVPSILGDATEEFSLIIWDNASTDGTVEYLKNEVQDPRIRDIILCKENAGQVKAVNEVWGTSKADLIGKLDNDCLVTPGWTRKIAEAHSDVPDLGIVGCWRHALSEFDERAARRAGKIQQFGRHQVLRHPWVSGCTFLMKRDTFAVVGPMVGRATTQYSIRVASKGYINGFYYPLILQEHMDDPASPHCAIKDDEGIQKYRDVTFVLREHNITSAEELLRRRKRILRDLNSGPWDAKHYLGWRGKLRRGMAKVRGILTGSRC
jgi:glycosyltransferase involved in cell wall biosynthesis